MWWDKILGSKPATADTKRNGGGREGKIRERKGIDMIQLVVGTNECIYGSLRSMSDTRLVARKFQTLKLQIIAIINQVIVELVPFVRFK